MISIILVGAENPQNIGAVARVMKNFGFSQLVHVHPSCDPTHDDALRVSTHAKSIVDKAENISLKQLKEYDYLVGTTALLGADRNIKRNPLTPNQLAQKISGLNHTRKKIGIVFGRESSGLTNEELALCDYTVTIPASKTYPTMNLSHAVSIILYELHNHLGSSVSEHIKPISKKDKEILLKLIDHSLNKMSFTTKEKKDTQKLVWKQLIGKAMISKKEALSLMGYFRKVSNLK